MGDAGTHLITGPSTGPVMNDPEPKEAGRLAPTRRADMPPSWWTLHVHFRRHVQEWQREAFRGSLDLLLLVGGLGGRWRRGFGSLCGVDGDRFTDPISGRTLADRASCLRLGSATKLQVRESRWVREGQSRVREVIIPVEGRGGFGVVTA